MAAVMAADSQILALSTMFTEDIFVFYRAHEKFGQKAQVATGRLFIVLVTAGAYFIALTAKASIFDLAVQYSFAGFSAMMPLYAAACTLWIAAATVGLFFLPRGYTFHGMLPVVPVTLAGLALLVGVSLATPRPSAQTIDRYFSV
jgi:Na+/proline symporter